MTAILFLGCNSNKKSSNQNNDLNNTNNTNNVNNTNNTNNINNINNANHQAQAVVGDRCPDAERMGLILVGGYENGPLQVSGDVQDALPLRLTEPVLTDANCAFNEELLPGFCEDCPADKWCTHESQCVSYPATVANLRVELSAGSDVQVFEPQYGGGVYGNITLSGDTFGVRVTWGSDFEVSLAALQVPAQLENVAGSFEGGQENPDALNLTWTVPSDPALVYTYIPINHHAAGATNTQCTVAADAGSLHIDGAMLRPLAVVTGLEFQELLHARFAAARVAGGCVEFRFFRSHYPSFRK